MKLSLCSSVARFLARALAVAILGSTGACAAQTPSESEGDAVDESALASGLTVKVTRDVAYGAAKDDVHVLDVYEPATGPAKNRPLVVWIHGGAFAYGTRRDPHLVRLAQHTASLGFVSVSIDYTLANAGFDAKNPFPYPGAAIAKARDDARAALRFMRQHATEYGIDPNDVAVGGASAGSITALSVAYGSAPANRDEGIHAVVDLWGALESPTLLQRGDAPLLILHGTADRHWMPFAQAERLRDSAKSANVPCTFIPLPGKNHGPWEDLNDYLADLTPFLREHLARH